MPGAKTSQTRAKAQRPAISQAVDHQSLFDALPHGYIAFLPDDPLFTVVAENKAHAAGAKPPGAIGKPLLEVFPDTSDKFRKTGASDLVESLRSVIKTGRPDAMKRLHYNVKQPDGSTAKKFWRVTHYPVFGPGGALALILQATEDITAEVLGAKQSAVMRRQSDEVLSVAQIGTWMWDIPGNSVIGDQSMAALFGLPTDEVAQGLPLDAFITGIHPGDRPRVRREIAAALRSGDGFSSEYRTIDKEGTTHWLEAHGRIERDGKGKPISFPGVLVDISERKLFENNLSYLAKASAVLSSSLDYKKTLQTIARLMVPEIADWCGVDILDDNGQLQQVAIAHKDPKKVKWARDLRRRQGPPPLDGPTGVPHVLRIGLPELYPEISDEMLAASAKNKRELALMREIGFTSVIIVPLKNNGRTVGALSLVSTEQKRHYNHSDLEMAEELASRASLAITNASLYQDVQAELSARTRLEEQLRVANEELENRVAARTAEMETANLSLQRSNQELQDFAYVASHDLQEPLRKIQAFGNLLETEYRSELGDGADYLSRMQNAAKRMSALIEDILSFSRVTTRAREFTQVDLETVAREVVGDLEIRIADTNATVTIGKLPVVQADAMQMRQLLQNLIANALKFHRPGVPPVVSITAATESGPLPTAAASETPVPASKSGNIKYCRLEVSDNGLGFNEKYLDRIFAVFQRLHNRANYEGTGIGLAVCRKIAERHGGSITATSQPGKGSTFIIKLPLRHKKGAALA